MLLALGAYFPLKSAIYSLVQIGVAAMVCFVFATGSRGLSFWAMAGLLFIVILVWRQWRALPTRVQTRLAGVFFRSTPA
jgi:4-hydroxybenzoate polyprenyltransferase